MITVIDYGMGNLRSVEKAFEKLGHEAIVSRVPGAILAAGGVVLPGVGAFRQAVHNLHAFSLVSVIRECIGLGKPFLGICLGMQLLFEESEEFETTPGLGIIPGRVVKFSGPAFGSETNPSGLKIPHMGWNRLHKVQQAPLLEGVPEGAMMYFVHSYYAVPRDPSWIATTTDHGVEFCSSICRDNLSAMQCHPEKSGSVGLRILKNFADSVPSWN
ncbi:MAG: imidazole glycerol phosphate synthase subunit HisH [Armatimonadetes bacterium]|nr:imidazole glycerol phosphate synthase subunit HisH [Armatimonadota bacterium]NIM24924.1 imidazole glycerol phosphate synthase subunit HisH [Armatimonadota bacterium]NIM68813.1 imidazole glycerol phosphate synthase subunit HisH [Armatimonadota bacterium]NIM77060.1 imidazole glycerol phosphate synthase subunit HisH [Armatimonadota bacterium]NIN07015.1 imidazole glycerol phosphate synthase subunit HisH [Armatimonadota bacterium]